MCESDSDGCVFAAAGEAGQTGILCDIPVQSALASLTMPVVLTKSPHFVKSNLYIHVNRFIESHNNLNNNSFAPDLSFGNVNGIFHEHENYDNYSDCKSGARKIDNYSSHYYLIALADPQYSSTQQKESDEEVAYGLLISLDIKRKPVIIKYIFYAK
ncbi:hypothetical protein UCRPC4_g01872 [Phaeomoniella chlamydospora]|uniref:Uncharacterized protein n=1 Tax=Phaeomoniella chlamydospora TaxID=158046 RepID=A0A0G2ERG5_PHACM|nr:hypothetical protein UCRPC4_g01872 [Phaeomoniella chlamydospora]